MKWKKIFETTNQINMDSFVSGVNNVHPTVQKNEK
jgi:hypothetical protein